jgi:hypothetical protein
LSTFNNILELDNFRDESISSLKNLNDLDIYDNMNPNNSINIKKSQEQENSKTENKKEMLFAAIFQWDGNEKNVYITGSFCNWLQFFEMRKFEQGDKAGEKCDKSYLLLFLPRGTYQYKFKINSKWKCNSNFPTCSDKDGNINNVTTIPPNTGEEVTTDFSTSHKSNINMNYYCQKNQIGSLDEFSYKYLYNYDLLSNQNQLMMNNYFKSKEKDILNGNYSYKKIYPIPHELINHFTIDKNINKKNEGNNKEKTIKYGCTIRYMDKMTTFVYYKPK